MSQKEPLQCPIAPTVFAQYCTALFYDDSASPETCEAIARSALIAFTAEEVKWVLEHKFRSGASKGASMIPT